MSAFTQTELEDGETMVIGPITFSSSSSVSFSSGGAQNTTASRSNKRVIGITNQRVIVEQNNEAQIIPNANVKRVYVKKEGQGLKIEKVESQQGQTITLDITGLKPRQEARLFQLFSNAEIGRRKWFGGFAKMDPPAVSPRKSAASRSAKKKTASTPSGPRYPKVSHISDADIQTVDDLRRYYPLPEGYSYAESPEKGYVAERLSDGAQFTILLEEGLLGFDVPVDDPKRRKKTMEIFKKN